MTSKLIGRGVLAGALAGLLTFVFARIFAEPVIQAGIDYEAGRDAAQDALDKAMGMAMPEAGPDIFSRTVQANIGIGSGLVVFGAAMGALFAVAYVICIGRVGRVRPRQLAMLVAGGGFAALYLVPFLKYPANPPAVGNHETIRERGALYMTMVVCSVLFLILAVNLGKRLQGRLGTHNATLIAASAFIVAIGVVMLLLPPLGHLPANVAANGHQATETPLPLKDADGVIVYPGFPADVLYRFRLYSVGAQLIMWTTIALVFGTLADRLFRAPRPAPAPSAEPAPAKA